MLSVRKDVGVTELRPWKTLKGLVFGHPSNEVHEGASLCKLTYSRREVQEVEQRWVLLVECT